jgi:hypothetical protein
MAVRCPTCFKVNPANAAYCYYDGRPLGQVGPGAALSPGSRPLPRPFTFPNGQAATTFNQLVIACDVRWNEARTNLRNGVWESYFSSIGRPDLAALARQSAGEPDPDAGLSQLLEALPADAEALRPAKLGVISTAEDLGALEPGRDHGFKCVIENQGVLLLRGWATTACDWLVLTDGKANSTRKLFQTRDTHTLWVLVVAKKLRAGLKPLEGQIVIETNGGCQTVTVRATVPIRPFPRFAGMSTVLAGALSPREVAVKAKAHPREAAALFEQGAVKAWYESNGWTYPVRGSQARGKGAVQQFFEALGVSRPPRLEIDTQRIDLRGRAGQHLPAQVVVRTAEAKFVHVETYSSQRWVKALPARSEGNRVTIPLRIDVPDRPGEALPATLTFRGNGGQEFAVPVTLTVAGISAQQAEEKERRGRRRELAAVGAGLFLFLAIGGAAAFGIFRQIPRGGASAEAGAKELLGKGVGNVPAEPPGEGAVNGPVEPPVEGSKAGVWWDKCPDSNLAASSSRLKDKAGVNGPVIDALAVPGDSHRDKAYKQLAAQLPELARNRDAREALGEFVVGCCVYEPENLSIRELLHGVAARFPPEGGPFPPEDQGSGADLVAFWLQVTGRVITHKAVTHGRLDVVTGELNKVLGYVLDSDSPPEEIKEKLEKTVVEECYHSMALTVEQSPGQALAIREGLIAQFNGRLTPAFRARDDVKVLEQVLGGGGPRDPGLWNKLGPILRECVERNDGDAGRQVVDLYEKAGAAVAPRMEAALGADDAGLRKIVDDQALSRAAKAKALRKRIVARSEAGKAARANRKKQFQALLAKTLDPVGKPGATPFEGPLRLAHASTLASILFDQDADEARFDVLIDQVPGTQPEKPPANEKPPVRKPEADVEEALIDPGTTIRSVQGKLDKTCKLETRRGTYRRLYPIKLRKGEIYQISIESNDFTPYLRLESGSSTLQEDNGRGAHLHITAPATGVYRLVVSTTDTNLDEETKVGGSYTLRIIRQQTFRFFGQDMAAEQPGAPEPKATKGYGTDVTSLDDTSSDVRGRAFTNLAGSLPSDLEPTYAKPIARYLLLKEWAEGEADGVKPQLSKVARCRPLLQELDDLIANSPGKVKQEQAEAVLEGLFGERQHFPPEGWHSRARKLLLRRMLELTERRQAAGAGDADKAAALLRDLYREQGLAFGMESTALEGQTQLTEVLESLIKHVTARLAAAASAPAVKDYPDEIDRRLLAARYLAAGNDLEYTVRLQRIWVEVLVQALQGRAPEEAGKEMMQVRDDLGKKDRQSPTLVDQLRLGEETALRVWALALGAKPE